MAFLLNLSIGEIGIALIGAIIIFGKDLPQVAMRGAAQFVRLRRQLTQMWRDAGLEEEMRKVRREVESVVPKLPPDQSFFDVPAPTLKRVDQPGPGLQAAYDLSHGSPDEDPDDRPDWDLTDAYGPEGEEQRALQDELAEEASEEAAEDFSEDSSEEAASPPPKDGSV